MADVQTQTAPADDPTTKVQEKKAAADTAAVEPSLPPAAPKLPAAPEAGKAAPAAGASLNPKEAQKAFDSAKNSFFEAQEWRDTEGLQDLADEYRQIAVTKFESYLTQHGETHAQSADAKYYLAALYLSGSDKQNEAAGLLREAVASDKLSEELLPYASADLGDVEYSLQKYSEAAQACTATKAKLDEILTGLADAPDADKQAFVNLKNRVTMRLARAQHQLGANDAAAYVQAVAQYQEVAGVPEYTRAATLNAALCHFMNGKHQDAITLLDAALENKQLSAAQDLAKAGYIKGRCSAALGDAAEAAGDIDTALTHWEAAATTLSETMDTHGQANWSELNACQRSWSDVVRRLALTLSGAGLKRYDEAIAQCDKLIAKQEQLQNDPVIAKAYVVRGICKANSNSEPDTAITDLSTYLDMTKAETSDPAVQTNRAEALSQIARLEASKATPEGYSAAEAAVTALAAEPKAGEYLARTAYHLGESVGIQAGNWDFAITMLKQSGNQGLLGLGYAQYKKGDFKAAEATGKAFLALPRELKALESAEDQALLDQGAQKFEAGDYKGSAAAYDKYLTAHADNPQAQANLKVIKGCVEAANIIEASRESVLAQAKQLLTGEDKDQAATSIEALLTKDMAIASESLFIERAWDAIKLREGLGQTDKVDEVLNLVAELASASPEHQNRLFNYALNYYQEGNNQRALDLSSRLLSETPGAALVAKTQYVNANAAYELKQYAAAIKGFQALHNSPAYGEPALRRTVYAMVESKDFDAAIAAAEQYTGKDLKYAFNVRLKQGQAYSGKAAQLQSAKEPDYVGAVDMLEKAISAVSPNGEITEDRAAYELAIGDAFMASGDYKEALSRFGIVRRQYSENPALLDRSFEAYLKIGDTLEAQGNTIGARKMYEAAAKKFSPEAVEALQQSSNLGSYPAALLQRSSARLDSLHAKVEQKLNPKPAAAE